MSRSDGFQPSQTRLAGPRCRWPRPCPRHRRDPPGVSLRFCVLELTLIETLNSLAFPSYNQNDWCVSNHIVGERPRVNVRSNAQDYCLECDTCAFCAVHAFLQCRRVWARPCAEARPSRSIERTLGFSVHQVPMSRRGTSGGQRLARFGSTPLRLSLAPRPRAVSGAAACREPAMSAGPCLLLAS